MSHVVREKLQKNFKHPGILQPKQNNWNQNLGFLPFIDHKFKVIPNDVEEKIVSFYRSDTVTRVCPGKKDSVSVETDGVKEYVQKCLMLGDLN